MKAITRHRHQELPINLGFSIFIWAGHCKGLPGSKAIQDNIMGSWNL